MSAGGFAGAVLRHRFIVAGDVPAGWAAFLEPLAADPGPRPARYEVRRHEGGLRLVVGRDTVADGTAEVVLTALLARLRNAGETAGGIVLHAAAVRRGRRILLLPGASGSGKSTLAAGLLRRGWAALADELVGVDPADGSLLPCPTPPRLAPDACERLGIAPDPGGGKREVPLAEIGPLRPAPGGAVTHLVLPGRGPAHTTTLSPAAALAELAPCVFPGPDPAAALDALGLLLAGVRCHRVTAPVPEEVRLRVEALTGAGQGGDPEDEQAERDTADEVAHPVVP